jgi:tetratricopeptide (TPR) repeat protein
MRFNECILWFITCEIQLGEYEKARKLLQECLIRSREWGFEFHIARCHQLLGHIAIVQRDYQNAQINFELFEQKMAEIKRKYLVVTYFGYAPRGLGQIHHARNQFHRAIEFALQNHLSREFSCTLPGIALLMSDLGQIEFAIELYELALKHPYVANSRWFYDVAGKHIKKVAESLSAEVVEAAQERGRNRDIWKTVEELLVELSDDTLTS